MKMKKAQQVYCLMNKSRTMKTPFDGLSLMDYAIDTIKSIWNETRDRPVAFSAAYVLDRKWKPFTLLAGSRVI